MSLGEHIPDVSVEIELQPLMNTSLLASPLARLTGNKLSQYILKLALVSNNPSDGMETSQKMFKFP